MSMHYVQSKLLRWLMALAGCIASTVFLFASGYANFRYWYGLADNHFDGLVYGTTAASADVFMALALFFAFAAQRNKEYGKLVASLLLWVVMTSFSAWSGVAQLSRARLDASSQREVVATNYSDVRDDLKDARQRRSFLPAHRPVATVQADLQAHKVSRLWEATNECDEASISGKGQREYCQKFNGLKGELGAGLEEEKLNARIVELQAKNDRVTTSSDNAGRVKSEADPGAATWASLTGFSVRSMQTAAALFGMLVLLIGAGLGFYATSGILREPFQDEAETQPEEGKPATPPPLPPEALLPEPPMLALEPPVKQLPPPIPPKLEKPPVGQILPPAKRARPEPLPEAREMLTMIGFPSAPIRKQPLRERDARDHVGWRYFAWLRAYELVGTFRWEEIDRLYEEFARADHRDPWSSRIVKNELAKIPYKWVSVSQPPDTMWTIASPTIGKVVEQLQRRGVDFRDKSEPPVAAGGQAVDKQPQPVDGGNVIPYVGPNKLLGAS